MPERTRAILGRLRKFIGERRRAERCTVRLPFVVSLRDERTMKGSRQPQSLDGYTLDISTSGVALIVSAIRIGDHYLAGENQRLSVQLELPTGPVEMQASPVRYERLDEDELEVGYLIGVNITEMNQTDRLRYEEYIAGLIRKEI
jgi:hypothetical protein